MVYFKLMMVKCLLTMVKCSLMMVKCSSMMVITDKYMIIHSFHHHWLPFHHHWLPFHHHWLPSLSSILPSLAWSVPSFAHLTIIEKLHRLYRYVLLDYSLVWPFRIRDGKTGERETMRIQKMEKSTTKTLRCCQRSFEDIFQFSIHNVWQFDAKVNSTQITLSWPPA